MPCPAVFKTTFFAFIKYSFYFYRHNYQIFFAYRVFDLLRRGERLGSVNL